MTEIWKEIIGYETFYEISNLGNIRRIGKSKSLTANKNRVTLCKFGKEKNFSVARLVAKTFVKNPDNKFSIRHINCLKDDNRAKNLEWY